MCSQSSADLPLLAAGYTSLCLQRNEKLRPKWSPMCVVSLRHICRQLYLPLFAPLNYSLWEKVALMMSLMDCPHVCSQSSADLPPLAGGYTSLCLQRNEKLHSIVYSSAHVIDT